MYLIDFDIRVSEDKNNLFLIRNNEVFDTKTGAEATGLLRRLVRIEEVKSMGFNYAFLDFDGQLNEWYELCLIDQTSNAESVTLCYYPEEDYYQLWETGQNFDSIDQVDKLIKAYKK